MTRTVQVFLIAAATAIPWVAPASVDAQVRAATAPITLPEAVTLALAHYPAVDMTRSLARGAEEAAGQVTSTRWPRLTATASAIRYEEAMIVTPIHGFTPGLAPPFDRTLFQGAAGVRYTLFDGFGRVGRIDAARSESDAAQLAVTGAIQSLTVRVSATYLNVLGGVEMLAAQDRRIAALEAERGRAQQLRDVGRAADVDLLRVEAALAVAAADRISLVSDLEVAEQHLSRLTGVPVERARAAFLVPVTSSDTISESRGVLLEQALQSNATVLQARQQEAAARARVTVARSERWPRLDALANYNTWASPEQDPVAEWNVGMLVSWPLFTGGAVTHEIGRAEAEVDAASARTRLMEAGVADDLDQALSSAREARARVASLTTAVARSDEVARIERLRLDSGSGVQSEYLDAEADLFAIRAALVQARHGEILASVMLARVTGTLGAEWLNRNFGEMP